ncbi:outer membrane protein assembly factor BamD [Ectothiorhodospira magna]|uniref:Outer membrane protein assembly factor BamD n=1 Tax=Ectothiorhodospira magna TaxID=867345 RepID=A0A1H8Z9C1_9GAMM|nr:outer membrane protein assembly factor BamD [Ectothiorhodospira magna]SEP61030.1 outer membrane protein assembly factor BamD [Ectothiorhodospira magna]
MTALRSALIVLFITVLVSGCASLRQDPTQDWSASQLYEEAQAALGRGNFQQAVEYYEILQARFPFGRHAQQGQLEIAYAYYKAQEPEMALAAVDRFLQMNPRHPHVDYAYYLRGLINYERDQSALNRWFPQDQARRDPVPLQQAFEDFGTLVRTFPHSRYAEDARQRMVHLRNQLAAHELHVADFYMRRGAWLAAAQRGRYVLERYAGAEAVPDALEIMVKAYRQLHLDDLAGDALRVLALNFPERAERLEPDT